MNKEDVDAQIEKSKYPLKKYYRNVLDFVENKCGVSSEEHKDNVNSRKVCAGIEFKLNEPAKGPYSLSGKIVFTEADFGFLWVVVNWLYTSFEKLYVEKNNAAYFGRDIEIPSDLEDQLERAHALFNWGRSLRATYSEWPTEILDFSEDNPWIGKITNIWIRATGFLFYHEYAHALDRENIISNILCYFQRWVPQRIKEALERVISIQDEKEADRYAIYNVCLYDNPDENETITNILGAVGAWVFLFFLIESPNLIKQKNHPDLDDRLNDLIKAVKHKLSDDKVQYLKMFCTSAIAQFCKINRLCDRVEMPGRDAHKIWKNMLIFCHKLKKSF